MRANTPITANSPTFRPKLLTTLRGYTRQQFIADLIAGLTVAIVALPLALAFGIASIPEEVATGAGVSPPAAGLFTAIVAGFLISALGGSRVSIGGPTGAFIVIIYAVAAKHGYDGLILATLMAGVMLVALGIARMGTLIKFIPYPVTTGFTTGIAVIILSGQIKDLLGLHTTDPADHPIPPEFVAKVAWCAEHIATINWSSAIMGVAIVAGLFAWRKWMPRRVPGAIVLLIFATLIARLFNLPVETIHDRFGAIPTGLPVPRFPTTGWDRLPELVAPAATIAVLAAIESLLCAVVADGMLGTRHRSNTELIAQGVANIASPVFGGIPATGAIARTATNVQSGGRTPIAGMTHAALLLLIVLTVGRFAAMIPLCALSGVLVVVAWNMSEMRSFRWLLNGPRQDTLVLLATFGLTVFTDLTIAVGVGIVLAALLFMKRMADVSSVEFVDASEGGVDVPTESITRDRGSADSGIRVYAINGPFFFGAAYKLRDTLDAIGNHPRALILDLAKVLTLDATGLHALEELHRTSRARGTRLILAGMHMQPMVAIASRGLTERLGAENLAPDVRTAINWAAEKSETTQPNADPSQGVP
ncbi:MAG: STAS domain-containing protein [Phycisphaeraceae bacterium]|nr:STAS domain-containing protein [Phycisphaerales bacterium]MCB9843050.1 STAS domain-containing protein [Phycisphaeraceae bacterium]